MTHSRTRHRTAKQVAVLGALALAAAACGGSSTPKASDTPSANADLGTANKATGSAIKIGYLTDGKTDAIDYEAQDAAFDATIKYANAYLGGINGHVIEVEKCETKQTPAGATTCSVQFAKDKVAAVVATASGQDGTFFKALSTTGIPLFIYTSANQDILAKPGAFLITNPLAAIGAGAGVAKAGGIKKAAYIVIDVPAASGPIAAIAKPAYQAQGVDLDLINISPSVADMAPQIQQALSKGDAQFSIAGTEGFTVTAIKGLKQAGFKGDILIGGSSFSPASAASIPGGFAGVKSFASATDAADDADVKTFHAVMSTYAKDAKLDTFSSNAFAVAVGFVRALTGVTDAVDAASITKALSTMPKALPVPLGAGNTFQCGAKIISYLPNICRGGLLVTTLDKDGKGTTYTPLG